MCKVTLRRMSEWDWLLFAEKDGGIIASMCFEARESVALDRAKMMSSWFDAELVVEEWVRDGDDLPASRWRLHDQPEHLQ